MDISPLWITIKVAVPATLISGMLGLLFAFFVYKQKRRAALLWDGVLTLPMVLPPTVIGYGLLRLLGRQSILGKLASYFDISILFTWKAMVIAAVCVSLPLMYKACLSSLRHLDSTMILAGRTLGLSKWDLYSKVILPNIKPGIVHGLILVFARSIGEFGATVMIAGNIPKQTRSMSLSIYEAVQSGDQASAGFWIFIMLFFSLVSMIGLQIMEDKKGPFHG